MKTPKILPWLARRAGIPMKRAETLWVRAVKMADLSHGASAGTSDYWQCAVESLDRLIAAEQVRMGTPAANDPAQPAVEVRFQFGPSAATLTQAMRYQARLGLMGFDIAACVARNSHNYWRAVLGRLAA